MPADETKSEIINAAKQLDWHKVRELARAKKGEAEQCGEALLYAVKANEYTTARTLLEAGATTIWHFLDTNNGCLHFAVSNNAPKMVALLIEYKADLSKTNEDKETPMLMAVNKDHWDVVAAIARAKTFSGSNDNCHYGQALYAAVVAKQADAIDALLSGGAPTDYVDPASGDTVLHEAVKQGDKALVKRLIAAGADLSCKNKNDLTPIQVAAEDDQWNMVDAIARQKDDTSSGAYNYGDALRMAIQDNKFRTAKILLQHKARTTWWTTTTKNSSLHEAVLAQDADTVSELIKHGAKLSKTNFNNETPMLLAVNKGYWDIVATIAKAKTFSDSNDNWHYGQALYAAVVAKQANAIDALLSGGAPTDYVDPASGDTVLHEAVKQDDKALVKRLIAAGADLSCNNKNDLTPIQVAACKNQWDMVDAIACAKDDTSTGAYNYGDALRMAAHENKPRTVKLLLEHKASITWYTTKTKNTSLHKAVLVQNVAMVSELIKYGAKLDKTNLNDETPMLLAVNKDHWDVVTAIARAKTFSGSNDNWHYGQALYAAVVAKQADAIDALLSGGAPTDYVDPASGDTVLHEAVKQDDKALVKRLIAAGADLSCKSKNDLTPIQVAACKNQWDMVDAIARQKDDTSSGAYNYGDALCLAIKNNKFHTAKILLQHKAKTDWWTITTKNTSLHEAVLAQDADTVSELIKHGAKLSKTNLNNELSKTNLNNETPMLLAANKGHWDIVAAIAKAKTYPGSNDSWHYGQALYAAVVAKQANAIDALLSAGAPTDYVDPTTGETVLHQAVKQGDIALVKRLIAAGADLSCKNKNTCTPIQVAAKDDQWNMVDAIARQKDDTSSGAYNYGSALCLAIKNNKFRTAKILLQHKAKTGWHTSKTKNTSLHEAVLAQDADTVSELIKHGADVGDTNLNNETPMLLAVNKGHWDVVIAIAKAQPYSVSYGYEHALKLAAEAKQLDAVDALLAAKTPLTDLSAQALVRLKLHAWLAKHTMLVTKFNIVHSPNTSFADVDEYRLLALEFAEQSGCWDDVKDIVGQQHFQPSNQWRAGIAFNAAIKAKQLGIAGQLLIARAVNRRQLPGYPFALDIAVQNDHAASVGFLIDSRTFAVHALPDNALSRQVYTTLADSLCDAVKADAFDTAELATVMRKVTHYQTSAMEAYATELRVTQNSLKWGSSADNSQQLDDLGRLLQHINAFIRSPQHTLSPAEKDALTAQQHDFAAAKDLLRFSKQQEQLPMQAENVKHVLLHFKRTANNENWQVQNLRGRWVPGKPKHIQAICKLLAPIRADSESAAVCETHTALLALLEKVGTSKRRADETDGFYREMKKALQDVPSFLRRQPASLMTTPGRPARTATASSSSSSSAPAARATVVTPDTPPPYESAMRQRFMATQPTSTATSSSSSSSSSRQAELTQSTDQPLYPAISDDVVVDAAPAQSARPLRADAPAFVPCTSRQGVFAPSVAACLASAPSVPFDLIQAPAVPADNFDDDAQSTTAQAARRVAI